MPWHWVGPERADGLTRTDHLSLTNGTGGLDTDDAPSGKKTLFGSPTTAVPPRDDELPPASCRTWGLLACRIAWSSAGRRVLVSGQVSPAGRHGGRSWSPLQASHRGMAKVAAFEASLQVITSGVGVGRLCSLPPTLLARADEVIE